MKKKGAAGRESGEESGAPRTFEQALARLEQIVERLEGGEETLENSVRLYEEAAQLWRFCEEQMHAAQERIEKLAGETEPPEAEQTEEAEA
jgi:exodeoxyribonuclease VII small subunit